MLVPHRILGCVLTMLVALATTGFAAADEKATGLPGAPRLLPEDTLAYIRIDNADELRDGLVDSSLGRMLADPKLRPFASDVYQTMAELFQQVGDQLGLTLDELLAIPTGQVAAALLPGNLSDEQTEQVQQDFVDEAGDESEDAIRRRIARKRREQNSFASLFVIEAGPNMASLQQVLEAIEQRVEQSGYVRRTSTVGDVPLIRWLPPRTGRPEIEYFIDKGTLVLGIGHDTAAKALDHCQDKSDEPTLADRAAFTSAISRCVGAEDSRPQITLFIDPYHIVERLVKRGGAAGFVWPIIEDLGLGKIGGIAGSVFRGGDLFADISHLHVLIDPPRDGFFGVLRPETGDTAPPTWVPSDVTSYTTIHWDFPTTFENLNKVIAKFQGEDPLTRLVEDPIKKRLDVSVRDDVLTLATGRYVTLRWIEPPIKLNSAAQVHAFEIKDPIKAKSLIATIRERVNDIEVATIGGNVVYQSRRAQNRKLPDTLRRPEPSLMIVGDWLIFSDSTKFLERVSLAAADSLPRLINLPEYELVSAELGGKLDGEDPFMVSFLRSSEYIRQIYELAQSEDTRGFLNRSAEKNPVAGKVADLFRRNQLPPFADFEKYFAPSGTFAYDEAGGMHLGSFTLKADE
jgi:hypothetical protein